jgi:hypothetical protein
VGTDAATECLRSDLDTGPREANSLSLGNRSRVGLRGCA